MVQNRFESDSEDSAKTKRSTEPKGGKLKPLDTGRLQTSENQVSHCELLTVQRMEMPHLPLVSARNQERFLIIHPCQ
jgi:hypothetical protein